MLDILISLADNANMNFFEEKVGVFQKLINLIPLFYEVFIGPLLGATAICVILNRFECVSVYHLLKGEKITEILKDELIATQKIILSLLNIQSKKYISSKFLNSYLLA